jgi:hypothetical protein
MDYRNPWAVTLNLKQHYSAGVRSSAVWDKWIRPPTGTTISEDQCHAALRYWHNLVSRKIYKIANKRHGKKIRMTAALERSEYGRWHWHILIEPPVHLTEQEFRTVLDSCWQQTDLGYGFHIQPAYAPVSWVKTYMLKMRNKSHLDSWVDTLAIGRPGQWWENHQGRMDAMDLSSIDLDSATNKQPVGSIPNQYTQTLIDHNILKAGRPGATCTCTSTARASMPSKATVLTCWTMGMPLTRYSPE